MPKSFDATRRFGAYSLIGAAVAVVFAMAHHPTGFGGPLVAIIHGVMIALAIVLFYGFLSMALWRGVDRPAVLAGIAVYLIGVICNLGAALLSGFVSPALVASGLPDVVAALTLSVEGNQVLARWGVYLTGVAYALFGSSFLRERGSLVRVTGVTGIVIAFVTLSILLIGHHAMNVEVALVIYSLQMLWALLVGVTMLRAGRSVSPAAD